ncbi:MAG: hypothetical protein M0Q91_12100 [Methanoregula sp.]|jgi:hypothetical protein|nr:hypothetical protein [Methanoregula sp.]
MSDIWITKSIKVSSATNSWDFVVQGFDDTTDIIYQENGNEVQRMKLNNELAMAIANAIIEVTPHG